MVRARSLVFYSWQSDLSNATNRGFIEKSLENAVKALRDDDSIQVEPVVDRDTVGVPGSPDIARTIFDKIDQAQVFVCDVSIINHDVISQNAKARPMPNPNVLIELGYALKTLGTKHIIMILNDAYGGAELLPFDLRMRRVIRYHMPMEFPDRATERKRLEGLLTEGLHTIFSELDKPLPGESIQPVSPTERAKKQSLYELLAQCTVRISGSVPISTSSVINRLVVEEKTDGFGTGFFVAPGLILTCAHVVKQAQEDGMDTEVIWNGHTIVAHIQEFRKELDLALLRVNEQSHPCVYMNEEVEAFDNLYSYGYTDDYPEGYSATFESEGLHGSQTRLLVFKGGMVRPGMAGAPVMNIRTGGVCGVINRTRDRRSAPGGRAIPTKSILQELAGVGKLQQQFHQQDRSWRDLLNQQQSNFWIY